MKQQQQQFKRHAIPEPPESLAEPGKALWRSLTAEYDIADAGGQAHLLTACRAEDDIAIMRAQVAADGLTVQGDPSKPHPLLCAIRGSEAVRRQSLRALSLQIGPSKNGRY